MLNKTQKGRAELRPGQRQLAQRERALLLLADGRKPDAELFALFEGQGPALALGELALAWPQLGSALLGFVQHGAGASFTEPALWTARVTVR